MTSEAGSRPLQPAWRPPGRPASSLPPPTRTASGAALAVPPRPAPSRPATVPATTSRKSAKTNAPGSTGAAPSSPRGRTGAAPSSALIHDDPLAALLDEAQAAVSEGANALRDVRERYRTAYLERVERWEGLRAIADGTPGEQTHTQARRSQAATDELVVGREVGQERSTLGGSTSP